MTRKDYEAAWICSRGHEQCRCADRSKLLNDAAPEMLEALREVEQYLENDSYSEMAYTVRAAIAKATGGGK